ncbi:hypothetical protein H8E88_06835 [candidate division KSB1 bacterium]|nr:hypothetical protein [candidate division KSB1 bacterium]
MKSFNRSKKVIFTELDKQILKETEINESGPGTILKDFNSLLNYLKFNKVEATKSNSFFALKHLNPINEQLSNPLRIGLDRPQQRSLPNISGLYLLLRTLGIVKLCPSGKKLFFQLNELVLYLWKNLNNTERYFTLLEGWLLKSNPSGLLNEFRPRSGLLLSTCSRFWEDIPKRGLNAAMENNFEESIKNIPGSYNIALLDMFGLLDIVYGNPKPGKGWTILTIKRNPLGDAIFNYLNYKILGTEDSFEFLIDYEMNIIIIR